MSIWQQFVKKCKAWKAIIRKEDGYPPSYKCFPTKQEAKDWATQEETRRRQAAYFPAQIAKKHTLVRVIDQYIELILPSYKECRRYFTTPQLVGTKIRRSCTL